MFGHTVFCVFWVYGVTIQNYGLRRRIDTRLRRSSQSSSYITVEHTT